MNNLVIIGHPDKKSFCYSGIFKVVTDNIKESGKNLKIIDLYYDNFSNTKKETIHTHQYKNMQKHQANIKLEKMSLKDLPSYISVNSKKYSDWID